MLEAWRTLDSSDKTSLILTFIVAIILGQFTTFGVQLTTCVVLYSFLRYVQRPWSIYDDESIPIFERHKHNEARHHD